MSAPELLGALLVEQEAACEISLCQPALDTVALGARGNQSLNAKSGVSPGPLMPPAKPGTGTGQGRWEQTGIERTLSASQIQPGLSTILVTKCCLWLVLGLQETEDNKQSKTLNSLKTANHVYIQELKLLIRGLGFTLSRDGLRDPRRGPPCSLH